MTYNYNNGWSTSSNFKEGQKKYIRVNPNKPNKAYVPIRAISVVYMIFTAIFLIIGIGLTISA